MQQDEYPDADDDAPLTVERKREVLYQVAAYRAVCRQVARSGTHALMLGGVMLFFWYVAFGQRGDYMLFSLLYLSVAMLELAVGLMNRFRPSAEGVFFAGLVVFVFGLSTLARQYMHWQGMAPGRPSVVFGIFGILWVFSGISQMRGYGEIRRLFSVRPTHAQLRLFDGVLRDIRRADPQTDPLALDLPTDPRIRGKFFGELAFLLVGGPDNLLIANRQDVVIEPEPADNPNELPTAELTVEGSSFGRFILDPDNWRNYAEWKAGKE